MTEPLTVYVGYDAREHDGWEVCRDSILRRASCPVRVVRLDQDMLRDMGLYRRSFHIEGIQRIDDSDGKPFSTDFTFTRFLVPHLNLFQGWALFCDCDFLFTADLATLLDRADPQYAVMCVPHDHDPAEAVKMDGVAQTRYRRKNWSSLVLWNCAHPANRYGLSVRHVNENAGAWLHAFEWLPPEMIGHLPRSWNWLSGVDRPLPSGDLPCGVHFTLGLPTMAGHEGSPYADLWRAERASTRLPGRPTPTERLRGMDAV